MIYIYAQVSQFSTLSFCKWVWLLLLTPLSILDRIGRCMCMYCEGNEFH